MLTFILDYNKFNPLDFVSQVAMFQDAKELLYNFVLFLYFCTFLGSGV